MNTDKGLLPVEQAARAILDGAGRPGSRMCLNCGPNGEDTWNDYKEVPQSALDALAAALAKAQHYALEARAALADGGRG